MRYVGSIMPIIPTIGPSMNIHLPIRHVKSSTRGVLKIPHQLKNGQS